MNNVAPLQGMAENLAQHGRYGDSMLVHMNPIEVQGIASLMPNGQLPLNPVTGQPEAFAFLAPLLGGFLGKALLANTLGSAALASALGSGVLTAAVEKDLGKGLAAGLMSFAGSKILGAGKQAGIQGQLAGLDAVGIDPGKLQIATDAAGGEVLQLAGDAGTLGPLAPEQIAALGPVGGQEGLIDLMQQSQTLPQVAAGTTNPFAAAGAEFMNPSTVLPFAIGAAEYVKPEFDDGIVDDNEDLMLAEQGIDNVYRQRIYDFGLPAEGIAPRDPRFAPNAMMAAAGGGLVSLNPAQYADKKNGLARLMGEPVRMQYGGVVPTIRDLANMQGYDLKLGPAGAQSAIRGTQAISVPEMQALTASGYRAGFDPELEYFRTPDRFENNPFPEVFDPRNPNAPVLPTDEQLAQELAEEGDAVEEGASTLPTYADLMNAQYGASGATDPSGASAQYLGPTPIGTGMGGVPSMAKAYVDSARDAGIAPTLKESAAPPMDETVADEPIITPSTSMAQLGILGANLSPSNIPSYTSGMFDIPVIEPTVSTPLTPPALPPQEMAPVRQPPPVMQPPPATQPPVMPPAMPPPVDIGFDTADDIEAGKVSEPADLNRFPNIGDWEPNPNPPLMVTTPPMPPPVMQPPVITPPMPPPVAQPPVMEPPAVDIAKLERILARTAPPALPPRSIPSTGQYKNPRDYIADLRGFRGVNTFGFKQGGLVEMQDMGQVPEMPMDPALENAEMMQSDPMQADMAAMDPQMADPMDNIDAPTQQLLEQTAMAILGQIPPEDADAIIQAFVEQFGSEVFQAFRDQVLTAVVPNAQTEGMLEGQGDGMSDEIMGMIGDQQRVAVSPGEYIVPADVVSGIGNGSSDAGAGELDRMLADIRQARTGMTEQPPEIDPRGAMPV
jgi:hypothetical protein